VCGGACNAVDPVGCAYPGTTTRCRPPECDAGVAVLEAFCQEDGACPTEQTQDCAPFMCLGDLCGGDCTIDTDCAADHYCSAGVCVDKLPDGDACGGDGQCLNGECVDGYCCNAACDGQCEACDVAGLEGTCSPATGAPHGGRAACAGTDLCASVCDGMDPLACAFPDETVACSDASCTGGIATPAGSCDGAGGCSAPDLVSCEPYVCGATECLSTCTGEGDCASGYTCSGGACVPSGADGDADGDGDGDVTTDGDADGHADGDARPEADGEGIDTTGDVETDEGADVEAPPSSGGGCGCVFPGSTPSGGSALTLSFVLGLLVTVVRRLRRR
jgi:hypothetical protein